MNDNNTTPHTNLVGDSRNGALHLVFVYGTLKKGRSNHGLLSDATYVGQGSINDFDLYSLGGFPGIAHSDPHFTKDYREEVIGEVYEVNNRTLSRLDMLEGYYAPNHPGNHYNRELVDVIITKTASGDVEEPEPRVLAMVYVYANEERLRKHKHIPSGEW